MRSVPVVPWPAERRAKLIIQDLTRNAATEIFARHRGKCLVIAGEEVFAADTPAEAWALADAAHPEDDGSFRHYIPKQKLACVYAYPR